MDIKKVDEIISNYGKRKSSLIPILQNIQDEYGWLPKEVLNRISQKIDIPLVQVYGMATFYKAFRLNPVGENQLTVCTGTACHVRGAPEILSELQKRLGIKPGETTQDRLFSLETVRCVGSCGLGPILVVNEEYRGRSNVKTVNAELAELRQQEEVSVDD